MEKRKKNRLKDYNYNQPGAYFITVCVKDRKPILSAIVGADDHIGPQVQLTDIGWVVEKYTRSVPGLGHYVIMPNHVHMILHISAKTPGDGPMWGAREALPVADEATRASGSGRQTTMGGPMWSSAPTEGYSATVQTEEIAGYRNRTSAPTDTNISNVVRTWKTLIAKELGQSIFQRSYYDHVIRDEQSYVEIAEYIKGNPGKWLEDKYYCL